MSVTEIQMLQQRIAELETTIEVERLLEISENPANHPDVKRLVEYAKKHKCNNGRAGYWEHPPMFPQDEHFVDEGPCEVCEALSALQGEKDAD